MFGIARLFEIINAFFFITKPHVVIGNVIRQFGDMRPQLFICQIFKRKIDVKRVSTVV